MNISTIQCFFSEKLVPDIFTKIIDYIDEYKVRNGVIIKQIMKKDKRYIMLKDLHCDKDDANIVKISLFIKSIYKRRRWFDKYYDIYIGTFISETNIYELEYNGDKLLLTGDDLSDLLFI